VAKNYLKLLYKNSTNSRHIAGNTELQTFLSARISVRIESSAKEAAHKYGITNWLVLEELERLQLPCNASTAVQSGMSAADAAREYNIKRPHGITELNRLEALFPAIKAVQAGSPAAAAGREYNIEDSQSINYLNKLESRLQAKREIHQTYQNNVSASAAKLASDPSTNAATLANAVAIMYSIDDKQDLKVLNDAQATILAKRMMDRGMSAIDAADKNGINDPQILSQLIRREVMRAASMEIRKGRTVEAAVQLHGITDKIDIGQLHDFQAKILAQAIVQSTAATAASQISDMPVNAAGNETSTSSSNKRQKK
jgi:hypothetical protein